MQSISASVQCTWTCSHSIPNLISLFRIPRHIHRLARALPHSTMSALPPAKDHPLQVLLPSYPWLYFNTTRMILNFNLWFRFYLYHFLSFYALIYRLSIATYLLILLSFQIIFLLNRKIYSIHLLRRFNFWACHIF